MTGRKQGKANARYEAGWQRLTFALVSRSLFSPAGQTNRFGSSKKAPAQRYWALPKSQDFRMPGRAASVEKVLLDQLRIQFAACSWLERVAPWHLATFDVRADHDAIHGPVERSQTLLMMAGGTGHRVSHNCFVKARAEALPAIIPAGGAKARAKFGRIQIFAKIGGAVTQEALINR